MTAGRFSGSDRRAFALFSACIRHQPLQVCGFQSKATLSSAQVPQFEGVGEKVYREPSDCKEFAFSAGLPETVGELSWAGGGRGSGGIERGKTGWRAPAKLGREEDFEGRIVAAERFMR